MASGKTIKLFMPTNKPEELIIATIDNWTGKGIRMTRNSIKSSDRKELNQHGVYFLFCGENNGVEEVYIGEAGQDTIGNRLNNHISAYNAGKETYYWHTAVFYVDNNLDKAKTLYIEDELVKEARKSKRYNILTKNTSSNALHDESDISAMDTFIENIKLSIGPLGYSSILSDSAITTKPTSSVSSSLKTNTSTQNAQGPTVPISSNSNSTNNGNATNNGATQPSKKELFYCTHKGNKATLEVGSNEYVLKANSTIRIRLDSNNPAYEEQNNDLKSGLLIDNGNGYGTLTKDKKFNSPSGAGKYAQGNSVNGWIIWKNVNGQTLKDCTTSK